MTAIVIAKDPDRFSSLRIDDAKESFLNLIAGQLSQLDRVEVILVKTSGWPPRQHVPPSVSLRTTDHGVRMKV